ncbi:cathepsin G-like isoform X1 [Hippopotamus amphibius kiboko]|uniref:cathepsin G-like isoform X1 n=1 Tax=Hippopotamus amphibius kiboko TaxID=575201 RepID=UPI00259A9F55|nr:cathepsin G-like isoform X1 [Hippopotamus amphibius kiboko]XP_057580014.1 cathepsin G-like isoform X1 [Hippopotamus amphibius kiboko]
MQPLLLLVVLLLPPRARAGQIIGGQEARPHSHPYMAYLQIQTSMGLTVCGGFLVREDFVMTAAHCLGSQINVILGAHNIRRMERGQQRIPVLRAIPHPRYSQQSNRNDIMLLQLRNRARRNRIVRPVALPRTQNRLRPGTQCTVAGWGLVGLNSRTDMLQDVRLTVQRDGECRRRFMFYTGRTQLCVGDPRERKSAFRMERIFDGGGRREPWKSPRPALLFCDIYLERQSTAQVRTQSPGNSQGRPISPLSLTLPVSTCKAALCLQRPCWKRIYRPHSAHLQGQFPS